MTNQPNEKIAGEYDTAQETGLENGIAESNESHETQQSVGGGTAPIYMTLQKAVDLGEYDPEFLSNFAEWHNLPHHTQFQLIRTALENRIKILAQQWASINNILDFSKKPELQDALRNIESQRRQVLADKERLYIEYSKV